jgi:ubiquitin-protein ligase
MQKNYKEQFEVLLPTNDLKLWHISFTGAKGTVFAGEKFKYE